MEYKCASRPFEIETIEQNVFRKIKRIVQQPHLQ